MIQNIKKERDATTIGTSRLFDAEQRTSSQGGIELNIEAVLPKEGYDG